MEKEFTPMVIGLPDLKKEKAIAELYCQICNQADAVLCLFEWFLSDPKDLSLFFEFLKSSNPKEWLYKRFIEVNKINVPGLSIEKIIELDLVAVPKEDFAALLVQRKDLIVLIEKTREYKFYYPLAKLFRQIDEDITDFAISYQSPETIETPDFDQALFNHVRQFTKTERENEILEKVNQFVDILNDLVETGIIYNNKLGWKRYLEENLIENLVFSPDEQKPFSINKNIARNLVLRKDQTTVERVFEQKSFRFVTSFGNFNDILSFVAEDQPAEELSEA